MGQVVHMYLCTFVNFSAISRAIASSGGRCRIKNFSGWWRVTCTILDQKPHDTPGEELRCAFFNAFHSVVIPEHVSISETFIQTYNIHTYNHSTYMYESLTYLLKTKTKTFPLGINENKNLSHVHLIFAGTVNVSQNTHYIHFHAVT